MIAQDYQTVIGMFNIPNGELFNSSSIDRWPIIGNPGGDTDETLPTSPDYPLFIVGNGAVNGKHVAVQSDAYEVTYGGHSNVHDVNGNTYVGSSLHPRVPYYGARYQDNTIVAWGDIPSDFDSVQATPVIRAIPSGDIPADFGVYEVLHPHGGEYIVCLQTKNTNGITYYNFQNGSVTATLKDDDANVGDSTTECGTITVSKLGVTFPGQPPNTTCFIVRTRLTSEAFICEPMDRSFYFKVCARP